MFAFEFYAEEATKLNKELVLGKTARLERDVLYKDKYDRILAYVYVDDKMVNEELVKVGLAKTLNIPPSNRYHAKLDREKNIAKAKKLGIWSNK